MTEGRPTDTPTTANSRSHWKPFLAGGCLGMLLGAILLLGGLLVAYGFFQKEAVKKMAEVKEMKPVQLRADLAWTVQRPDGTSLDLQTLRGRPIFLHVWRPECVSCVAEIPGINALFDTFAAKGIAFVSIALDDTEELDVALAMHDVHFPVYTRTNDTTPSIFETRATPATFIIDQAGFIVYNHSGAVEWDSPDARDFLERLCEE